MHGTVSIAEARTLAARARCELPEKLPTIGGQVPLSELRRLIRRRNNEALDSRAYKVKQLVRPSRSFFPTDDWMYGVESIAHRLGLSLKAARKLMCDGVLVCHQSRRGTLLVTPEELAAYLKTHRGEELDPSKHFPETLLK